LQALLPLPAWSLSKAAGGDQDAVGFFDGAVGQGCAGQQQGEQRCRNGWKDASEFHGRSFKE
jgi:hypothetical protein